MKRDSRERFYPVVGNDPGERPPDYARVARGLRDKELDAEIAAGRGDEGYQQALLAERERRTK